MAEGREKSQFDFLDDLIPSSLEETLQQQRSVWIDTLVESLERVDRVSSGALAQSIDVDIEEFETHYTYSLIMEDYWDNVDEGRAKGGKQPPESAMLDFMRLRGIKGKAPKTVKPRKKAIPQEKLNKSLAFAMAKSIQKKGIEATNFYTDEIEGLRDGLAEAIENGIADNL